MKKIMSEPISTASAGVGIKYIFLTYCLPFLSILAGVIAHVLEEVKTSGWKGWVSAFSSGFVAFFAGYIVFTFALAFYPAYAGGIAGLGGFFGTKSIYVLVRILKTTIKEI